MRAAVLRHPFLVRAPAEFRRLQALRHEAFHGPGVHEHAHGLRVFGALRVALGDVDALHADALHELRPILAGLRLLVLEADVPGDVEERLLHEPGHHARIGAAAVHRRGAARRLAAGLEDDLAQSVVGARLRARAPVEVEAGPGLRHGVDVERTELAAEFHDVARGGVHRHVHAEPLPAAFRQERREDVAVVVRRQGLVDERHAAHVEHAAVLVAGIDDREAVLVELEMALDQGQHAFADRAEADHHDRAGDAAVNGRVVVRVGSVHGGSLGHTRGGEKASAGMAAIEGISGWNCLKVIH